MTELVAEKQTHAKRSFDWRELLGPAFLVAVVLILLGPALFSNGMNVLSAKGTDVEMQFVPWREFGFGQMRHGHFPLWNPHLFSGTPYAGALQAALLYPLNWIFLFLPVGIAINWNIGMHVMLAGIAMYCWARYRGVSRVGSTLGGMTYMLSGQFYLHIMPGHLPWLCVTAWVPLVMMSCDGLLDLIKNYPDTTARTQLRARDLGASGAPPAQPSRARVACGLYGYLRWVLFGAFVAAMQILSGYPQPVYIAGFVGSLYLVLNLFVAPLLDRWLRWQKKSFNPRHAARVLISWFSMWIVGALISAVWLGAGVATQAESGRAGGTPFEFASTYFLPWQNLITLLVGNFWGGVGSAPQYTGEWLVWEVIVFMGAGAVSLALMSLIAVPAKSRRFAFGLAIFCIVIALGVQTPLYRIMFDCVPGFSRFRGSAKWAWMATILLSMMTAMGWDVLIQRPRRMIFVVIAMIASGVAIGTFGYRIGHSNLWPSICGWTDSHSFQSIKVPPNATPQQLQDLQQLMNTKRQVVAHDLFADTQFIKTSGTYAANQCYYAMAACLIAGACLLATRLHRQARWGLAALLVVETALWAHSTYRTTPAHPVFPQAWLDQKDRLDKEDARALIAGPEEYQNLGMNVGIDSMWGYDPVMLRRYVQLVAATQGYDPDSAVDSSISFRAPHPLFSMLRCRCVMFLAPGPKPIVQDIGAPMPRLNLIGEYRLTPTRDETFSALAKSNFYPRSEVLLESEPEIKPTGAAGEAKVLRETTDEVEIEVSAKQPTILLVTDSYSNGWRARALSDSVQDHYTVMPANWILRAIPLNAGKHHFVMEYLPREYVIGKWISIIVLPVYLAAVGWMFAVTRKNRLTTPSPLAGEGRSEG